MNTRVEALTGVCTQNRVDSNRHFTRCLTNILPDAYFESNIYKEHNFKIVQLGPLNSTSLVLGDPIISM